MYRKGIKRALDFMIAFCGLVILSPLFLLVMILLSFYNKRSGVFFMQERPGYKGEIFKVIKFKSMTDERDEFGELLPNEKRITPIGKFIRKTSLDELPQLINVLKGDMSLIGPRPLRVDYLPLYSQEQARRHDVRPGITGWAQVNGRNAISWDGKLATDLEYVQNVTFLGDCKIILDTVKQVFLGGKGSGDENVDEVAITDDFGDYLLKAGRVSRDEYEVKQAEAKALLM